MTQLAIRPRFQQRVFTSQGDLLNRFRQALPDAETGIKGAFMEHHLVLRLPTEARHFWSPQLHLEIEPQGEEESLVRGLYGPSPTVWLMFVFFYALLGFIAMVVMIMGFSQLNLGLPARILWLLPIIGGIVLMMLLSARAGQRMGREQMELLHLFTERILKAA